jgi:hypothetical protein
MNRRDLVLTELTELFVKRDATVIGRYWKLLFAT